MSGDNKKYDAEIDYIFTFGSGQEHGGHYVKIKGTFHSAREEMFRRYGDKWSFQYPIEKWNADWEEIEKASSWIRRQTELEVEE